MKVAFFGTPQFAVPTLQRLLESRHQVVVVVTQPDKPAGRGRKLTPPPVKAIAESAGIPVLQPASVKKPEFLDQFTPFGADVAVVAAYGKILPVALLKVPHHGFLNVHASLLPRWRGAAPIQWAIASGDRVSGVSIMEVTEGLDEGPVVVTQAVDILVDDDARSLHDMLSMVGAEQMVEVLDELESHGHLHSEPQDAKNATYAPLIKREDGRIEWTKPAENLICQIRGFVIWPGAYTKLNDVEVKLLGVEGVDPSLIESDWQSQEIPVGAIIDILPNRGPVIKCGGNTALLITRLKFAGKAEMDGWSAVNGGHLAIGTKFDVR